MATDAEIIDAVAAIGLEIDAISDKGVFGCGTDFGKALGVQELPDEIDGALPALMVLAGDDGIIAGQAQRQQWTLEASVWTEYSPRGPRYRDLIAMRGPILTAFAAHSKGGLADPGVQSVLITTFGQVETRRWTALPEANTGTAYLVLPFTLQVRVNRIGVYLPA